MEVAGCKAQVAHPNEHVDGRSFRSQGSCRSSTTQSAILGDDGRQISIRSRRITQSPPTYLRISERALPLDPARHSTKSTTLCRNSLSTLRSAQQIHLPRTPWLPALGSRKPDRGPAVESPRESNIARSSDLCLTLAALSHSSWWVGCFLENYGIGFPFARVEDSVFIRRADDVGVPVSGRFHRQTEFHFTVDPDQRFLFPHLVHG